MLEANNIHRYTSRRITVPPEFADVFSHFYVARNASDKTVRKTLLPSYQTIFVFNFGTKAALHTAQNTFVEIDKCLVLGPIKQAIDYSLPPLSDILVVNLIDDAFYRFFGRAPTPTNLPTHPDALLDDNCFTALWSVLNQTDDPVLQLDYLLQFCKPYLSRRSQLAEALVNFEDPSMSPIKAIASEQHQSERNIQLNHKKQLGYSAKELTRYQRFIKAIALIQQFAADSARAERTKVDWFEVINACGYYDQSQLIHDFKHYLNLSPTKYLKFQEAICNPTG